VYSNHVELSFKNVELSLAIIKAIVIDDTQFYITENYMNLEES